MLDTAQYYHTYEPIRLALAQQPDLAVCTKSYAYDEEGARQALTEAQTAIGREYIDVMLLHEQESRYTLEGHRAALAYYQRMQREGQIGLVGLSTHHIAAVHAAADAHLDLVFAIVNQRGIGIVDGTRAEMEEALDRAKNAGLFVMAMKALAGGHLLGQREAAMDYVRALPFVDAVAVGMANAAEVDYNIACFAGERPSEAVRRRSGATPRQLMVADWCQGCGRCVERCDQKALRLVAGQAVPDQEACVRCGYCAAVCPGFCIKVI